MVRVKDTGDGQIQTAYKISFLCRKNNSALYENFISGREIYISRPEMYISAAEMYISRAEMKFIKGDSALYGLSYAAFQAD